MRGSAIAALLRIAFLAPAFLTPLFAPPLFAPFQPPPLAAQAPAAQPPATIVDLGPQLEPLRAAGNVPALGAAVVTPAGIVARGVTGVRKQGDPTPVEVTDLWHIGSITKSFTSTLFARQVEAGKIRFEQTLAEVLPEATGTPYAAVKFEQLLVHRSGMPANPSIALLTRDRSSKEPLVERRRLLVAQVLGKELEHESGTKFLYSNAGYVTIGAALERLNGKPWEELVRADVLDPLGLRSGGFGAPGTAGAVDQPWGHMNAQDAKTPPHGIPPGPLADNAAVLGPAGTLHLSIDDLAAWVREHLNGETGTGTLLKKETYQRLHHGIRSPPRGGDPSRGDPARIDGYAMGWVDDTAAWADGERLIWHNGSNGMWYAMIGFLPERGLGLVVVTNCGAGGAEAVTKAFEQLGKEWLKKLGSSENPEARLP